MGFFSFLFRDLYVSKFGKYGALKSKGFIETPTKRSVFVANAVALCSKLFGYYFFVKLFGYKSVR